jgi:hypothetical protein
VLLAKGRAWWNRLVASATKGKATAQSAVCLQDRDPLAMLGRLALFGREWRQTGVLVGRDGVAGAVVADSGLENLFSYRRAASLSHCLRNIGI